MKLDLKGRMKDPGDFSADSFVRALLEETAPRDEILPWYKAVELIDSAPPVVIPWYSRLLIRSRQQLAYAAGPAVILILMGVLWAMPAQSNYAGTIMTTGLPSDWTPDSIEVNEVESVAFDLFETVKPDYGEMYFKVTDGAGRPRLALAMIGLDRVGAEALVTGLEDRYPALQVYTEDYTDISSEQYKNRLDEIFNRLQRKINGSSWKDSNEIQLHVLDFLRQSGFDNVNTEIVTTDDGRVIIEIDATFKFEIPERTQEALEAAGLNEEVLGSQAYERLLDQLGN